MRIKYIILGMITLLLCSCGNSGSNKVSVETATTATTMAENKVANEGYEFVDDIGDNITFTDIELESIRDNSCKVGVLNGSMANLWSISGGTLSAVTEDAYDEERIINITDSTINVGAMKSPNIETLIANDIDIVILSATIKEHVENKSNFQKVGIKTIYFSVEDFKDYLRVLTVMTDILGAKENYEKYGHNVEQMIEQQISRADGSNPTVLFIRAYSSGAKVKGSDSMTGIMLKELGCINIADSDTTLLEDLSMEAIIMADPDYIFVTTMGSDEEAAHKSVKEMLIDNPAWNTLSAVKNDNYYVIPKNLFHNKPNERWGESYKLLADILYPEK